MYGYVNAVECIKYEERRVESVIRKVLKGMNGVDGDENAEIAMLEVRITRGYPEPTDRNQIHPDLVSSHSPTF